MRLPPMQDMRTQQKMSINDREKYSLYRANIEEYGEITERTEKSKWKSEQGASSDTSNAARS